MEALMRLPTEMTLAQIAAVMGGKVEGDANVKVSSVALSPLKATTGDIAFVFEKKLLKQIEKVNATAVVVPEGVQPKLPYISVARPNLAIQKVLSAVQPKRYYPEPGVHASAVVDPTAQLGEGVAIGPRVVVGPKCKIGARTKIMAGTILGGEVTVGEDCLIHPGCLIADYVQVGNRVTLQQGASLGPDGFGYVTERPSNMELKMAGSTNFSNDPNPLLKIPQIGTVIVEDDVEIGSNTCIDRATMGATIIGKGSKIDNLVMIAHNCKIGKEVIVVAHAGIAGSCTIDDRAIIAGHAGLKDHLHVASDSIIEGKAAVMKDVAPGEVVVGVPAQPAMEFFNQIAHLKKLPKMFQEFRQMKERVAQLEQKLLERQLV